MMEGLRTNTSRPSSWIRSVARLCRPLPILLLRLLLSLPGRWLQLLALAWGALLGRDRLLMQAEEEEADWQEVLKALSGGPLHSQGLYLGKESMLWEPGLLGGVKGMPSDTLGGLPSGLLEGLPSSLLEGIPADVLNHHLKIMNADEGQVNIQNFPGFSMVSCVLGQQWTEYDDCGKEYNSQCRGDVYKDLGNDGYHQWQYSGTGLHSNYNKTTVQDGTGFADHVRKRSECSYFNSMENPESGNDEKEPLESFTKTETPDSLAKRRDLAYFSTKRTYIPESLTQKTVSFSEGEDANFKRTEATRDGAISIPDFRISSSESQPHVYPEPPQQLCEAQASAEGPGSASVQRECTKHDFPELQLIRTKRLDFLGQISKAYLLPTPDQDHGYCSLEENLLHQLDQDTPCSYEGSFLQQCESSQGTGCMDHKTSRPFSCSEETHTWQQKDHNIPVGEYSMSWQDEDPYTNLCEKLCHQASHDGSNARSPPDISCLLTHEEEDTSTGTSLLVTDLARGLHEKLDAYRPSQGLFIQHTEFADEHYLGGVDSDIEEDLPVPVRPVCNNKLIDYILGAVYSDEEAGSSDSEADWDEEDDDGFDSEGSLSILEDSEDQQLWKSFSSQDPYHPNNFTAPIETALKIKEEHIIEDCDLLANSDSEDESSWGESSSGSASTSSDENDGSSDEDDDSEDSADEAENLKLWNSFNNSDDPYNPLCFKAPVQTVKSTKSGVCFAGRHSRLGTVGSHCCIPLPLQEQPSEISGVGLDAVHYSHDSGRPRNISKQKKVTFLDQVTEYCVSNEDRKGQWEEYARDRCRFQKRIQETEQAIGHCFTPVHRQRLWVSMQEK